MAGPGVVWQHPGPERFLIFLAVLASWSAAWLALRPRWFLPATCAAVAIYTIAAVGVWPLAAVLFFLLACLTLGRLLTGVTDLVALLAGLCATLCLVSLLAHFPVNYPATYALMLGAILLVRPRTIIECFAAFRNYPGPWIAIALVPILAHWLIVLKPEVGADALSMHMVVPAFVANHHQWSFDFRHAAWAVMPMGGVWCYTVPYLLGGEFAARLLNFALLVVICAFVYRLARRWVDPPAAFLLVALFASTPIVQMVTGSLYIENFYAVLFLGALAAAYENRLVIAGFLLGCALAVKLTALPFVLAAALLLYRRKPALAMLAFGAPPYLYAWWKTGNPVFPFFNNLFHSPYFAQIASPDPRFTEPLTWRTLYDITFETHRYWEGQDGSAGFQLLLIPLVLLAIRRDWRFVTVALGSTVLAFLVKPNLRYLYPAFPVLTLGLALVWRRVLWPVCGIALALNLLYLPSSSFYHKQFCLNPFDRGEAKEYVAANAPARLAVERLNREHAGGNALFLSNMDIAGLRAAAYSDGWHSYLFLNRVTAQNTPDDVARLFRQLDIRHFVYPVSTPVHEAQVRRFLLDYTKPEAEFGAVRLASLSVPSVRPPAPPAPPGRYDDSDPRIFYYAHWTHGDDFPSAARQSVTYSDAPGAAFRFTFRGSKITWVYTKAFNRGIARAGIDGTESIVDLWAPAIRWQSSTVFSVPENGVHTLEVRAAGKNPRASGSFVDVDALIVE